MKTVLALFFLILADRLYAQEASTFVQDAEPVLASANTGTTGFLPKLRQHNYGAIIGIQRGRTTAFEMGAEMHWRKISLRKPHIWGATTNIEYSFADHIVGYKAGVWRKQGRVNLTYGANLVYFNNFEGGQQFGIAPAVGFRFAGLHLVNGINILSGEMKSSKTGATAPGANTLYMSLRYYFPVSNKFVWDRKHKKDKDREGLFHRKEPEKERKGLFNLKKKEREPERRGLFRKRAEEKPKEPEQKGLRGLFQKKNDG